MPTSPPRSANPDEQTIASRPSPCPGSIPLIRSSPTNRSSPSSTSCTNSPTPSRTATTTKSTAPHARRKRSSCEQGQRHNDNGRCPKTGHRPLCLSPSNNQMITTSDYVGTLIYNPENMTLEQKQRFKDLRDSTLKTARAWAIKELAMSLWHYVSKTWARKGWEQWLSWAVRSRLDPVKEVAKTICSASVGIGVFLNLS
jgi:hypothetical protein